jgi:hypothetical protein
MKVALAVPRREGGIVSFLLNINYLSYAFCALLRRNIIAFQALQYAYVPGIKDVPAQCRKRPKRGLPCLLALSVSSVTIAATIGASSN